MTPLLSTVRWELITTEATDKRRCHMPVVIYAKARLAVKSDSAKHLHLTLSGFKSLISCELNKGDCWGNLFI